jgi:preprotein translocase subunit SecB
MTEPSAEPSGGNGAGDGGASDQPPLVINAQYVKDLSFETPSAPQVFAQMQRAKPDMQVKVDVQARRLQDNIYEVTLHIRADCKAGEMNAFICELTYGGVFTVNVAEDALSPVLLIECPRLLFPYARQIISSTTLDGGFMPLMLAPVDFVSLYHQQLQHQQEGEAETTVV